VSDGLKHFYFEMNIRNSKTAVTMLYEKNFMQLHDKNVKIHVSFYSHLKLLSEAHSFVTGNRHLFNKAPTVFSIQVL